MTKIWLFHTKIFLFLLQPQIEGAVMAPPWANPKLNPCALQPRGWQLLFWPPDGKCYKIFQVRTSRKHIYPTIIKNTSKLLNFPVI
ncbi:hypothetical protein NQ314_005246 [Rhamnusium bicolor]|uniref:Secreted protein n=1 Tax=Rhamnusium bicolor TaxID=1586634 RepID=A0AAV8ZJ72_9CUCU|nr:hypothetical protein NQ314_005246 [Rhamnusium bicolor]